VKKKPTPMINLENLINGEVTNSTLKVSKQDLIID
jgi:hypothetical protein